MNMPKTHIDLYILNEYILRYVNSISAKATENQQHLHSAARTQWLLAGHVSQGGNDVEDQGPSRLRWRPDLCGARMGLSAKAQDCLLKCGKLKFWKTLTLLFNG